jgi:NifU-like protein involved in Fe-S cluster formation
LAAPSQPPPQEIAAHLNLPPVKLHCSMLAEDAINAAVADYKKKKAARAAAATAPETADLKAERA